MLHTRGEYQRCLRLSEHNVRTLIDFAGILSVFAYPEFIQLMDDNINSLIGLTLIVNPSCRDDGRHTPVPQLYFTLYLMTQCQMKLHHPVTCSFRPSTTLKSHVDVSMSSLHLTNYCWY